MLRWAAQPSQALTWDAYNRRVVLTHCAGPRSAAALAASQRWVEHADGTLGRPSDSTQAPLRPRMYGTGARILRTLSRFEVLGATDRGAELVPRADPRRLVFRDLGRKHRSEQLGVSLRFL